MCIKTVQILKLKVNKDTSLTQIVCVAILFAIYQSYCLGIEAVQEPVGVRLDAAVSHAVR